MVRVVILNETNGMITKAVSPDAIALDLPNAFVHEEDSMFISLISN